MIHRPDGATPHRTPARRAHRLVTVGAMTVVCVTSGAFSESATAAPQGATVDAGAVVAPAPSDAILGWILGADFPDLSAFQETWASTAFPNRCITISPLPCP